MLCDNGLSYVNAVQTIKELFKYSNEKAWGVLLGGIIYAQAKRCVRCILND